MCVFFLRTNGQHDQGDEGRQAFRRRVEKLKTKPTATASKGDAKAAVINQSAVIDCKFVRAWRKIGKECANRVEGGTTTMEEQANSRPWTAERQQTLLLAVTIYCFVPWMHSPRSGSGCYSISGRR